MFSNPRPVTLPGIETGAYRTISESLYQCALDLWKKLSHEDTAFHCFPPPKKICGLLNSNFHRLLVISQVILYDIVSPFGSKKAITILETSEKCMSILLIIMNFTITSLHDSYFNLSLTCIHAWIQTHLLIHQMNTVESNRNSQVILVDRLL